MNIVILFYNKVKDMLNYNSLLDKFGNNKFNRSEILKEIRQEKPNYSEANLKRSLSRLVRSGRLMRVSQGHYIITESNKKYYSYKSMNTKAIAVKDCITSNFPLINFILFEMVQLNEFVNHQIGKNTIFIEIEKYVEDAVFERLREEYESVLFFPNPDDFYRYSDSDSIVVKSLPCRYPKNAIDKHGISIEKLIVDLFANKIISNSISRGDYPDAITEMFSRYQVNEIKLFRYASIRRITSDLEALLNETGVNLYTRG